MKSLLIFAALSLSLSAAAYEGEPAYCQPENFFSMKEKRDGGPRARRMRVFQVGDLRLAGYAVGSTEFFQSMQISKWKSNPTRDVGYCTWYFNRGNGPAQMILNHRYVKNPRGLSVEKGVAHYSKKINRTFFEDPVSMLHCAEEYGYLGMGCNGQKHRGPTVFGMFLAFSGCHPENANRIANKLWGLNDVKRQVRMAIIEEGYRYGNENPEQRQRLQDVMLGSGE